MARPRKGVLSSREQIVATLKREIADGVWPSDTRLPSLRALAQRFRTSIAPVQEALKALGEEGWVEPRHGSGVYVLGRLPGLSMGDSAILCFPVRRHVCQELNHLLHTRLHDLGMFVCTFDTAHGSSADLLRRALHSEARFIILDGGRGCPFQALSARAVRGKCLIALLCWESETLRDRMHRLLVDHAAGSVLLAEHLRSGGHRHVLLAGPSDMLARAAQWDGRGACPPKDNAAGAGLAALWSRAGGRLTAFECCHDRKEPCDENDLLDILAGADAPTAIVGLRDTDIWCLIERLRRIRPAAIKKMTFIGQGNTPWSRAGHAPFATLDWNLEVIADLACAIVRDVQAGKTFRKPVVQIVPPRLIVPSIGRGR